MNRSWSAILALIGLAEGCSSVDPQHATSSFTEPPLSAQGRAGQASTSQKRAVEQAPDPAGVTASLSTNGFDPGPSDAFFDALGTNGRTCNSCHRQDEGWTISAAKVQALASTNPNDPLFSPVDGSDCPPTSTDQGADAAASTMLTGYGVIRIQIPVPGGADFSLVRATNPLHCAIAPGDSNIGGALFLFRRPLPTANLEFLSTVMWDGRETHQKLTQGRHFTSTGPLVYDLSQQDNDAAQGHEQAAPILGTSRIDDLLGFERNIYTAQLTVGSLDLDVAGGSGGPRYIGNVLAPGFFIGENDPLQPGFTPKVFTIFEAWEPDASGRFEAGLSDAQQAIGRGEQLFNTKRFTIANVPGLNSAEGDPLANSSDPLFDTPFTGTCTTCHNAFDVGDHSTSLPLNVGVTMFDPTDNAGNSIAGILDVDDLPVYTLRSGAKTTVQVTDPGRALISGKFVDVGKTKGPVLRGLSSRAPYFHNGSAKDLATVVDFYDARFDIGLTDDERRDIVAFLSAL